MAKEQLNPMEELNRMESELSTKEFLAYLVKQSRDEVREGMGRRAIEAEEKSSEQGSPNTNEDLVAKLLNLLAPNFDETTIRPLHNPRIAEKVHCYLSQSSPEGLAKPEIQEDIKKIVNLGRLTELFSVTPVERNIAKTHKKRAKLLGVSEPLIKSITPENSKDLQQKYRDYAKKYPAAMGGQIYTVILDRREDERQKPKELTEARDQEIGKEVERLSKLMGGMKEYGEHFDTQAETLDTMRTNQNHFGLNLQKLEERAKRLEKTPGVPESRVKGLIREGRRDVDAKRYETLKERVRILTNAGSRDIIRKVVDKVDAKMKGYVAPLKRDVSQLTSQQKQEVSQLKSRLQGLDRQVAQRIEEMDQRVTQRMDEDKAAYAANIAELEGDLDAHAEQACQAIDSRARNLYVLERKLAREEASFGRRVGKAGRTIDQKVQSAQKAMDKKVRKHQKPKRSYKKAALVAAAALGALGLYRVLGKTAEGPLISPEPKGKPYRSVRLAEDGNYGEVLIADRKPFCRNPYSNDQRFYPIDVVAKIEAGKKVPSKGVKWIAFRTDRYEGGADVNHDNQKDLIDSRGNTYTSHPRVRTIFTGGRFLKK